MAESKTDLARNELRVLRLLGRSNARLEAMSQADTMLVSAGEFGVAAAPRRSLESMVQRGLIEIRDGSVSITQAGTGCLGGAVEARTLAAGRDIELAEVHVAGAPIVVPVDMNESPLAMLARRRGKDGRPFLNLTEWRAGERFRSDYTRGRIMPRLGANWEASVSSGRRDLNGTAELTDAALAARLRVDNALEAVGPELSGVLVDICCFLKGLELVEIERRWPVRSAKVMLKAALSALARHYEPNAATPGRRPAHPLHWGADGYRPSIKGAGSRG